MEQESRGRGEDGEVDSKRLDVPENDSNDVRRWSPIVVIFAIAFGLQPSLCWPSPWSHVLGQIQALLLLSLQWQSVSLSCFVSKLSRG